MIELGRRQLIPFPMNILCVFSYEYCVCHIGIMHLKNDQQIQILLRKLKEVLLTVNPASLLMVAITDVVGSMLQEKKDAGRNRA